MKKKNKVQVGNDKILINQTTIRVRFSELDPLRIVWHGNFLKYFEDGREAFGKEYKLGYLDFYKQGLVTPIVDINCQYKKHLAYSDEIIVETIFLNTDAAKIIFDYNIYRKSDNELVATGRSVQVFLTTDGALIMTNPDYYISWKQKYGMTGK